MIENDKAAAIQKPASYSPRMTDAIRRENRHQIVTTYRALIRKNRKKINLSDSAEVDRNLDEYLDTCETDNYLPSVAGFCAYAQISRDWFYAYLQDHEGTPSADRLRWFQSLCAAVRISANEAGALSDASLIFLLKNSGQGFMDRVEITPSAPANPLHDLDAETARRRLIESIPEEDD